MLKRQKQLNTQGGKALFARLACLLLLCAVFVTGVIFAVPSNEKNSEAAAPITAYSRILPLDVQHNVTGHYEVMMRANSSDFSTRNYPVNYVTHMKNGATFPGKSGFSGGFNVNHATTNNGSGGNNDINNFGWAVSASRYSNDGLLVVAEFNAGFQVPARSKCRVKYTFLYTFYFVRTTASGGSTTATGPQRGFIELLSFGQTGAPDTGNLSGELDWQHGVRSNGNPAGNYEIAFAQCLIGENTYSGGNNISTEITLINDADTPQVVTADFAVIAGCLESSDSNSKRYLNHAAAGITNIEVLDVEPLYKPEQPASTTFTYSGVEQTIDVANFDEFLAEGMYVSNIVRNADGATGTTAPSIDTTEPDATKRTKVKVTDAGTYTVTATRARQITSAGHAMVADGTLTNFSWVNPLATDADSTTFELTVKKKQLTVPNLAPPANEKDYTGETLEFDLPNYPHTGVAATPAVNPTEAYPRDPLSAVITRKLNGVAQSVNGLPAGSPEKKVNASNAGFLRVSIVDAGDYEVKISISDKTNYEWVGATPDQTDKTVTLKVKPKQLALSFKSDYTNDQGTLNDTVLSWKADQSFSAEFTIDGIYNGNAGLTPPTTHDDIEVTIKLTKENDSSFTPIEVTAAYDATSTGAYGKYKVTIDKTKFPDSKYAVGTYAITFTLTNTSTHKKNESYSLANALQSWTNKLVITASSAGLDKYVFKYTVGDGTNQGTATDFRTDSNGDPVYKVPYTYNTANATGMVYRIEVDQTDFADAKIAVDTSKTEPAYVGWSNGYYKG